LLDQASDGGGKTGRDATGGQEGDSHQGFVVMGEW
jgi:hypothetical protein